MSLRRRIDRLSRAIPSPSDDLDRLVVAFIEGLAREELRAILDHVRGRDITPEQAALLVTVEERWQSSGLARTGQPALPFVSVGDR